MTGVLIRGGRAMPQRHAYRKDCLRILQPEAIASRRERLRRNQDYQNLDFELLSCRIMRQQFLVWKPPICNSQPTNIL